MNEVCDQSVHRLVEQQAAQRPDAVALVGAQETLTYAEMNGRANRLARHLRNKGLGTGQLAAVRLERSVEMVVAMLAILKAGGAYVPLDPGYPQERQEFMLEDAAAKVVLFRDHLELATSAVQVPLDAEAAEIALLSADNLDVEVDVEDPGYVMYTSGSTGKPKGVCIPHRSIKSLVIEPNYCTIGPDDVMLHCASVSFDSTTFEVWGALLNGAKLVVMPSQVPSLAELGAAVRTHGVTVLLLTAGVFAEMAAHHLDDLRGVRDLLSGGDVLSTTAVNAVLEHLPETQMINVYGPTECSTFSTYYRPAREERFTSGVPIGYPLQLRVLFVVDEKGNQTAQGEAGELYIGGAGLGTGYWKRPELSAEKFVQNPFGEGRLYRTGDLVRLREDGVLEFLGRIDGQVKIRGFRVETGEIEHRLMLHGAVKQAVVIAREDRPGDKRLVAYVVPEEGAVSTAAELRAHVADGLPEYMVPAAFVELERIPLTPNGKVDRKQLPAPAADAEAWRGRAEAVLPRTELEQTLTALYEEALGVAGIGVFDNFFELGGHSLIAMKIAARLRDTLPVAVPLQWLFEASSVAELAARIEGQTDAEAGPRAGHALVPVPRDGLLELSFSQERVWFLRKLAPENLSYSFQAEFRYLGQLNVDALQQSLQGMIDRHEIFRTSFPERNGRPYQQIHEPWEVPLPVVDLTGVPAEVREAEVQRLIREEVTQAFEMAALPLVRWKLLRLSAEEHVLIHVEDHLVHDGWSLTVFVDELQQLYKAAVRGEQAALPELEVQFADFAQWERRWMQGEEAQAQLAYWTDRLGGAQYVLDLPTDRPRPPVQRFKGKVFRFDLDAELCDALRAFSKREGVTLYMTLFAAFNVLLHRHTGQEDLLVGSALANRRLKEMEPMIGMLVSNIVLRTQVQGDLTFRELLGQVKEAALEGFAHVGLPFEKLVEALQPDRDLSRNPLFQVSFSFHDSRMPALEMEGLEAVRLTDGLSNETSKFDMNIIVLPRKEQKAGDGITISWEYDIDLFEADTVARMIAQYQELLQAAVAGPETAVGELPLLNAWERERLLTEFSGAGELGSQAMPQGGVLALIEQQAANFHDHVAVVHGGQQVTYGELNRRANALAHRLMELGVGAERTVGILLERSVELVVAVLAVAKAGGAYVPLDPAYPQERLAFLAEDAGLAVLVTTEALRGTLSSLAVPVLVFEQEAQWRGEENPGRTVAADQLAYVIYTSGSTGTPKGVEVEQRALWNLVQWNNAAHGLTREDRTTLLAGTAFDASVWELWPGLAAGATLVIPDEDTRLSPGQLLAFLAEQQVTLCFLPTPLAERVIALEMPAGLKLRRMLTGGDLLHPVAQELPFALVNHYGPTENAVVTTCADVQAGTVPPIGKPISGVELYVLDARLQPVPLGVAGELYVGGNSLARGYRGRPDLTAERFVAHPFRAEGRLYRTGDRVRFLADGNLEFLGRLDGQVKIRGHRVELGEVEASILQQGLVESVVVVARGDGEKRLVAYVTGTGLAVEQVRAGLEAKLPGYMVPSAFVVLEALPLTPNGKVDLRALPEPVLTAESGRGYASPRNEVEAKVAAVFAEVLGVEKVGIHEDFFYLGGHSLLVTQVISRLRDLLDVELPLPAFFADRTAAGVAARIIEDGLAKGQVPKLVCVERTEEMPVSFAQQRLYFLNQLAPENPVYNIPLALRLRGAVRLDALERAVQEIAARHEALRTVFVERAGEVLQRILPEVKVPFAVREASDEAQAAEIVRAEGQHVFDLSAGPLLRVLAVRLGAEEHVLVVNVHHIVFDGWSFGTFAEELAALYTAFVDGIGSPLPAVEAQYADFAVWQRSYLQGKVLEEQLSFWREFLGGPIPQLGLPFDYPRPELPAQRGAMRRFALSAELSQAVKHLCEAEGVTLFMALLAAFDVLLYRLTEQTDLLVGTPVAGRTQSAVEGMIGFFVNTLVLRSDLSGNPTFRELLGRVREMSLQAFAHQEVPFEKLVERLQPERSASQSPFFSVMFVLQNVSADVLQLPGVEVAPEVSHHGGAKYDLTLSFLDGGDVLYGQMEYSTELFAEGTVGWMIDQLVALLEGIVAAPDTRIAALEMQESSLDELFL
ncbi:amino acid adenylation domain-containing protein [Tumebacillus sp. BK434]|uniref:amino acid adenylation domain-containing protein n=1 Tax=Tumebacillus sp. BK434 TaxID=2512169 RepID=UPI00104885C6|nr:non-ribosomal peptide synthetase [Tumebacillus sp. BK434]TCP57967.1 amino acid adenylation domain-containing protein [Tumebacillus sp. BK434]